MPFQISYSPVTTIGQLAQAAGQGEARQRSAQLALQQGQLNLARYQEARLRAAQAQAFALQKAAVSQMARAQPQLVQQVSRPLDERISTSIQQAEASGLYSPEQIAQAKLLAPLGGATAVARILGELPEEPRETSAERERQRQMEVVRQQTAEDVAQIDEQIAALQTRGPSTESENLLRMQALFQEHPELTTPEDMRRLSEQIAIAGGTLEQQQNALLLKKQNLLAQQQETLRALERGFTLPSQERGQTQQERTTAIQYRNMVNAQVRTKRDEIKQIDRQLTGRAASIMPETEKAKLRAEKATMEQELDELIDRLGGVGETVSAPAQGTPVPTSADTGLPGRSGLFEGEMMQDDVTGQKLIWKNGEWNKL